MVKKDAYEKIYDVRLDEITISENNVRHDPDLAIEELAEDIKQYGLKQPVILMGKPEEPPYELIIGQRRFKAHEKLGKETIRAIFEPPMDEIEAMIISLGENMHRVELNYDDKATAITFLYKHFGKDAKKTSEKTGLDKRIVLDYVMIEEQGTPKLKEYLRTGKIIKKDAKRVLNAAQGNRRKINELVDDLPKLKKPEKDRAVEYGRKNQNATVNEIIREGKTPRFEPTILLNLTLATNVALNKAVEDLALDRETIVKRALDKWLRDNKFLS